MLFGVCAPCERAGVLKAIGYDYVEPALRSVAQMDEDEFNRCREALQTTGLRAQAFNVFLGGELRTTGPDVDLKRISDYAQRALARVAALGGRVAVYGSAASRNVPEGFPRERALEQLQSFLRVAGDAAHANGIKIAIEPLRSAESNIINRVPEAAALAKQTAHPAVGALADLYHMADLGEAPDAVLEAADSLSHVHIARPGGREFPRIGDGSEDIYLAFFSALKRIGYDQRISVEGSPEHGFERSAADALEALRRLWEEA